MSGFFAMARPDGNPIADQLLQKISAELAARGPDGNNIWNHHDIAGCFAFMRSGPAPQAQQQPVSCLNRLWLWGDLRLDGRHELQQQLSGQNCAPETTSEDRSPREQTSWARAKHLYELVARSPAPR